MPQADSDNEAHCKALALSKVDQEVLNLNHDHDAEALRPAQQLKSNSAAL
jgi:hypothetical protein